LFFVIVTSLVSGGKPPTGVSTSSFPVFQFSGSSCSSRHRFLDTLLHFTAGHFLCSSTTFVLYVRFGIYLFSWPFYTPSRLLALLATSAHRTRPDTKRQEEQPTITRDNSNKPTREAPKICLLHKARKKTKKKIIKTLGDREETKKNLKKKSFCFSVWHAICLCPDAFCLTTKSNFHF